MKKAIFKVKEHSSLHHLVDFDSKTSSRHVRCSGRLTVALEKSASLQCWECLNTALLGVIVKDVQKEMGMSGHPKQYCCVHDFKAHVQVSLCLHTLGT